MVYFRKKEHLFIGIVEYHRLKWVRKLQPQKGASNKILISKGVHGHEYCDITSRSITMIDSFRKRAPFVGEI